MKIKTLFTALAAVAIISLGSCSSKESTASTESESASATSTEAAAKPETVKEEATAAGVYELPEGEALAPKDGRIMMVDFNAEWCAPCKKFRPTFDAAAEKYSGSIDFVSVNMDLHPEIVEQYGIEKYPTIVFIMPDGSFDKHEGLVEQEEFFAKVDEHLARVNK